MLLIYGCDAASHDTMLHSHLQFSQPCRGPGFTTKSHNTTGSTTQMSLDTILIQHVSFAVASFSNKHHIKQILHTHDALSCAASQTYSALLVRTKWAPKKWELPSGSLQKMRRGTGACHCEVQAPTSKHDTIQVQQRAERSSA